MEHKLYTAVIVSIPEDDYAYGEIVGISETRERAYEIGCRSVPAYWSGTVGTYLVIMGIPADKVITSHEIKHNDILVYHYNEETGSFKIMMKKRNFSRCEKCINCEEYSKEAEEAEEAARNIFGWE